MTLNTNDWAQFPFEVDGVQFVSKIDTNGDIYPRVLMVPEFIFNQMNIGAVRECIGSLVNMTRSEIIAELERVNEGATQALIELV